MRDNTNTPFFQLQFLGLSSPQTSSKTEQRCFEERASSLQFRKGKTEIQKDSKDIVLINVVRRRKILTVDQMTYKIT